jgi:hypothetical protein
LKTLQQFGIHFEDYPSSRRVEWISQQKRRRHLRLCAFWEVRAQ